MSFDRATRALLANAVGTIRERLKTDAMDELRRLGFQDDGSVLDLHAIGGLTEAERSAAAELRALLAHLIAAERGADGAGAKGRSERDVTQSAYDRLAREIGFTTLNRLVALRMAEERGLIVQSVGAGLASGGFQIYERLANGALGSRHETYRAYLECLYDEIARDLPALFDRADPHSRIFPGERCLEDVLDQLNRQDLAHLWAEDETIGWVYQYYNDPHERKRMRESQAPRTSRELAVRNQFFTPRYVVEFLTDNTLGRTWYEMRRGETRLTEQCRYMVRRKRPVFLGPTEEPPRPFQPADGPPSSTAASAGGPLPHPGAAAPEPSASPAEHGLWTRPNPDLDDLGAIERYALTFDGYRHAREQLGATEDNAPSVCGAIAERLEAGYRESGKWQGSFADLRIALFHWQRRFHHRGEIPDDNAPAFRALYQAVCTQWDLETEYIPYRAPKDPRDIKILDPACGSGHFLLHAFDLLTTIYEESWTWDRALPSEASGATLRDDYPHLEALRRAAPALILAHNLHGIDIDPRACQIGGLALWLRAQRAYQALRFKAAERPPIGRGNIVCAAPMPGERHLFTQFLADLHSPTLARLCEGMWDELSLAGVAGSLLKPEVRLQQIIAEERALYLTQSRGVQQALLTGHVPSGDQFDFSDVTGASFWDAAEERILTVLREYSEQAEDGDAISRRLFAGDGAQGFRFVDLLRQRYDVVLMNPPFGATTKDHQKVLDRRGEEGRDLAAAFISQSLEISTPSGYLGAITTRSIFFLRGFTNWRKTLLLTRSDVGSFLDLGFGVLDAAVEVSALTLHARRSMSAGHFINALGKHEDLDWNGAEALTKMISYKAESGHFAKIPRFPLAYWASAKLVAAFQQYPSIEDRYRVISGGNPRDDFRFIRLWTETHQRCDSDHYVPYSKGGEYGLYYYDVHLALKWRDDGEELKAHSAAYQEQIDSSPSWRALLHNYEDYFSPGITWPRRTGKLNFRVLPSGCVFGDKSPIIMARDYEQLSELLEIMGYLNTTSFAESVGLMVQRTELAQSFEVGLVRSCPLPILEGIKHSVVLECFNSIRSLDIPLELSHSFAEPALATRTLLRVEDAWKLYLKDRSSLICGVNERQAQFEQYTSEILGPSLKSKLEPTKELEGVTLEPFVESWLSYGLGCVYGRWDARIGKHPEWATTLGGAFDALPVCSPGMLTEDARLVGMDGPLPYRPERLPAGPEDVPDDYPVPIEWSGLLVDDETQPEHDLVARVQGVLGYLFEGRTEAIEQEACEILKVKALREYFRRPASFFAHHLSQYSKSRRQAPIYWPLSTQSGSYTIWVYYHRLTSDTLFTAVNRHLLPKVDAVERDLADLGARLDAASGREATRLREEVERTQAFRDELVAFRDELLRVAALPYQPNLNDGAIINAAPLHRLFRLPRWAKDTRECWGKLERGDYDWAHLAYTIWPDRVREKCRTDKSFAIAHGLEELYVEPPVGAKKRRTKAAAVVEQPALDGEDEDDG